MTRSEIVSARLSRRAPLSFGCRWQRHRRDSRASSGSIARMLLASRPLLVKPFLYGETTERGDLGG